MKIFLLSCMLFFIAGLFAQQQKNPWSSKQLLEPEALTSRITQDQTRNLLILSVGPEAVIKNSVDIGPASETGNIIKLKNYLKDIPKDKEVVIYCGCCPFDRCPNVRPAFKLLQEMGFKNARLLNLTQNIKVNWLDKNYPVNESK